jgi:hypothetical protein
MLVQGFRLRKERGLGIQYETEWALLVFASHFVSSSILLLDKLPPSYFLEQPVNLQPWICKALKRSSRL